jgi:peptidoglycan hydrolase CwlO-like protein
VTPRRADAAPSNGSSLRTPVLPPPPASNLDKSRALQAYVSDLESQKFELQRGLQQQAAAVARLADDHAAASARFESVAAERDHLADELAKCQAALGEQV